jgi:hypothetical protein
VSDPHVPRSGAEGEEVGSAPEIAALVEAAVVALHENCHRWVESTGRRFSLITCLKSAGDLRVSGILSLRDPAVLLDIPSNNVKEGELRTHRQAEAQSPEGAKGVVDRRERESGQRRLDLMVGALVERFGVDAVSLALQRAMDEAVAAGGDEATELLTLQQVAQVAGVAKATVHDWLVDDKLKPRKYEVYSPPGGGEVFRPLVDKQELVVFLQNKRSPGRPKRGSGKVGKLP